MYYVKYMATVQIRAIPSTSTVPSIKQLTLNLVYGELGSGHQAVRRAGWSCAGYGAPRAGVSPGPRPLPAGDHAGHSRASEHPRQARVHTQAIHLL